MNIIFAGLFCDDLKNLRSTICMLNHARIIEPDRPHLRQNHQARRTDGQFGQPPAHCGQIMIRIAKPDIKLQKTTMAGL